jgi:predicted N-acyltransferase
MQVHIHKQISDILPASWNALTQGHHPFIQHEFLHALEKHGCVGEAMGWIPRHIAIYNNDVLVAAMPLYIKTNSYGEFVFDNAWADAYERSGLRYFPKLVSAIPYSPVTGPRLLCQTQRRKELLPVLLQTALELAESIEASSFHCLFPEKNNQDWLESQDLLIRHDCQFHWHNYGYASFDDFLQKLSAKKRKNIRQERRRVTDAKVSLRRLDGNTASDQDWKDFANFYNLTFEEKWGYPTLNYHFFREVAQSLPEQTVLVLADKNERCIAGALMYCSDDTLYGRHWGCTETVNSLHFEACYYQGIEYCLEQGIEHFEPGAQGEHKLSRGFEPTLTRSSHWLRQPEFKQSISHYVRHEREAIASYITEAKKHLPFKEK